MEFLPWYIAGPLIGLFVPLLLIIGNKQLGISSSFDYICSLISTDSKGVFSKYDFKKNAWKFYFVGGIAIGAFVSNNIFSSGKVSFLPDSYYTIEGILLLFAGGILVGFGTRYANGCTSGHAIMGISLLQKSSVISTLSFFISGLIFTFIVVNFF
jgi:uncharacterized protein